MRFLRLAWNEVRPQDAAPDLKIVGHRCLKHRYATLVVVNARETPATQKRSRNSVIEELPVVAEGEFVVIGDGQGHRRLIHGVRVLALLPIGVLWTVIELTYLIFRVGHLLGIGEAGKQREAVVKLT